MEMTFTTIAILISVYIGLGVPGFLLDGCLLEMMLTHHFFHANIFHLAANCVSVFLLFRTATKRELALAYIIGSVSLLVALRPAVGISNMLYALIGMRTPSLRSSWWRRWQTWEFLALMVLMAFIPNVSATSHICAFILGMCASMIRRRNDGFKEIYRQATGYKQGD